MGASLSAARVYDELGDDADDEISMSVTSLWKRAVARIVPSADKCCLNAECDTASPFRIKPFTNDIEHKMTPIVIVLCEQIYLTAKGKTHCLIGFGHSHLTQSMLPRKSRERTAFSESLDDASGIAANLHSDGNDSMPTWLDRWIIRLTVGDVAQHIGPVHRKDGQRESNFANLRRISAYLVAWLSSNTTAGHFLVHSDQHNDHDRLPPCVTGAMTTEKVGAIPGAKVSPDPRQYIEHPMAVSGMVGA